MQLIHGGQKRYFKMLKKYSKEAVRFDISRRPKTDYMSSAVATHVQTCMLVGKSSIYCLFVVNLMGAVTTSDRKNSKYMLRYRMLGEQYG